MTGYRLTVRTLDFHSKNVGSNPASLIILKIFENKINDKKKISIFTNFVSIITPGQIPHLSFESCSINNNNLKITTEINKIHIKQSYLILTWFQYFKKFSLKNNSKVKFFISKKIFRKFTTTKAPIAHKNWSKEQFQFDYYRFNISAYFFFKKEKNDLSKKKILKYSKINRFTSVDQGAMAVLSLKNELLPGETNTLNAKSVAAAIPIRDKVYFSYFLFSFKK